MPEHQPPASLSVHSVIKEPRRLSPKLLSLSWREQTDSPRLHQRGLYLSMVIFASGSARAGWSWAPCPLRQRRPPPGQFA